MPGMIENSYGEVVGTALKIVRPFKNIVKRPECRVHKFINLQSVNILGNDGNAAAWEFFNRNMRY
jgi:phospholipase C